ncbi:ERC protein 2 [Triplophysa tibetana]|uniref:ERC protein 2 n=1 Tax=Triplophysa tibetana TaxID=1572043 RepID=A0A5A9PJ14_9TELE|nr:ERC protein 2 [Triplophysa tibetana]
MSTASQKEALLAAISEKDANIALLELSSSKKKKTQDEVALLKREKDRLVQQLKQQFKRPCAKNGTRRKTNRRSDTHIRTLLHSSSRTHAHTQKRMPSRQHPSLMLSLNDRLSARRIAAAFHRKWVSVVQIAVGLDSHPQP